MVTTARTSTSASPTGLAPSFVVTERRRSAHFVDLHLSDGRALMTWAVPNGPSAEPGVRRLAIACTQDAQLPVTAAYDRGTAQLHGASDLRAACSDGRITFTLNGSRLRGGFTLVHVGGLNWVLQKVDTPAERGSRDALQRHPASRVSPVRNALHSARGSRRTVASTH